MTARYLKMILVMSLVIPYSLTLHSFSAETREKVLKNTALFTSRSMPATIAKNSANDMMYNEDLAMKAGASIKRSSTMVERFFEWLLNQFSENPQAANTVTNQPPNPALLHRGRTFQLIRKKQLQNRNTLDQAIYPAMVGSNNTFYCNKGLCCKIGDLNHKKFSHRCSKILLTLSRHGIYHHD